MEGFKNLLFSALVLAMLVSFTLATPALRPAYGVSPGYHMSAEAQELERQNNMANYPDYASLQQNACYQSLYILAFTSDLSYAQSDSSAYVEMRLTTGEVRLTKLYDRKGDDFAWNKGDLWKISLSNFGFTRCITRSDIAYLGLVEGGNDGWNIESIVTFLKHESSFLLLSQDFDVYRWLDGDTGSLQLRFDLTLV